MLVMMMWGGTGTTGEAITTAPGLYPTAAECSVAAGLFNTATEMQTDVKTRAICIPGPTKK